MTLCHPPSLLLSTLRTVTHIEHFRVSTTNVTFAWWFVRQTCDIFSIFVGRVRQPDSECDANQRLLADGTSSLGTRSQTLFGCDPFMLLFYLRCPILILLGLNTLSVNPSTSLIFL